MNDYLEAMRDAKTERPITHVLTIPVGMVHPNASESDVLLLLNRAITGIMHSACQCNLVPAYIGHPVAEPVGVFNADTELLRAFGRARDSGTQVEQFHLEEAIRRRSDALYIPAAAEAAR